MVGCLEVVVVRKVIVVRAPGDEISEDELRELLAAAGCEFHEELELASEAIEALQFEPGEACLVVPLTAALDEAALEAVLIIAERRGCSVIGIWPQDSEAEVTGGAIAKHADYVIPWDPQRLEDCIGDGPPKNETPDGASRERPITPTNKC